MIQKIYISSLFRTQYFEQMKFTEFKLQSDYYIQHNGAL